MLPLARAGLTALAVAGPVERGVRHHSHWLSGAGTYIPSFFRTSSGTVVALLRSTVAGSFFEYSTFLDGS
jgi:hypothetical protein